MFSCIIKAVNIIFRAAAQVLIFILAFELFSQGLYATQVLLDVLVFVVDRVDQPIYIGLVELGHLDRILARSLGF